MPRSYEDIVNQAKELSRAFEEDFEPAISTEEAAVRAAALRRAYVPAPATGRAG